MKRPSYLVIWGKQEVYSCNITFREEKDKVIVRILHLIKLASTCLLRFKNVLSKWRILRLEHVVLYICLKKYRMISHSERSGTVNYYTLRNLFTI